MVEASKVKEASGVVQAALEARWCQWRLAADGEEAVAAMPQSSHRRCPSSRWPISQTMQPQFTGGMQSFLLKRVLDAVAAKEAAEQAAKREAAAKAAAGAAEAKRKK